MLHRYGDSDMGTGGAEQDVESVFLRRTLPLIHIRELTLSCRVDYTADEEFLSVFQQCPGLEKLGLLWTAIPAGVSGADIGRICSNLRDISYIELNDDSGDKEIWPLKIMEVLPEAQMEMLDFIWTPNRPMEGTVARTTIPRHSHSLRMIKIVYQITSSAIRLILETCGALEVLDTAHSPIDLSDAVASPWASSKMTRLCLSVSVTLPSSSLPADIQYVPSYLKTPPVPLAEDRTHFHSTRGLLQADREANEYAVSSPSQTSGLQTRRYSADR